LCFFSVYITIVREEVDVIELVLFILYICKLKAVSWCLSSLLFLSLLQLDLRNCNRLTTEPTFRRVNSSAKKIVYIAFYAWSRAEMDAEVRGWVRDW